MNKWRIGEYLCLCLIGIVICLVLIVQSYPETSCCVAPTWEAIVFPIVIILIVVYLLKMLVTDFLEGEDGANKS